MPWGCNISNTKTGRHLPGFFRWGANAVLAVVVLLAQVLPMNAGHGGGSGDWLEICGGEDGSYYIQLDDGSELPAPTECQHCDACMLFTGANGLTTIRDQFLQAPSDYGVAVFGVAQTAGLAGSEQYWAACRGPPLENSGKIMPRKPTLASYADGTVNSDTWSAPCI